MTVFDIEWFARNQRNLLRLANNKIGRTILGIKNDEKILRIQPHALTWGKGDKFVTEFRGRDVYASRLYGRLKPLWRGMHLLDEMILDRINPALGFGFATLNAYPDPNPETNTVDGYVGRDGVDEALATIIAGAGTTFNDSLTKAYNRLTATATSGQYITLNRSIFLFKTDSIGADIVTDAVLHLYGQQKYSSGLGSPDLAFVSSNPASNTALANADYGTLGATEYASRLTWAAFSTAGYNNITFNASGRASINTSGITKLGARLSWDVDGSAPWVSGTLAQLVLYTADQAATSQDPYLTVTHAPPSGSAGINLLMRGVG